jgi:hypothetical protein
MRYLCELTLLLGSLAIFTACQQSKSSNYKKLGSSTGQFGVQSILGETDSDDYDEVIEVRAPTLAYSNRNTRLDSFEVTINDVSLSDRDNNEFDYVPTKKYSFKIKSKLGRATGSITAPSISRIQFVTLPDTHYTDHPLEIEWKYPAGESNDGAIIVDASGHNSGLLPPETKSYTIPGKDLANRPGYNQISITSIRYVKFPELLKPSDNQVRFIEGLDAKAGSYFGVFVSINRYVEVIRSNQ